MTEDVDGVLRDQAREKFQAGEFRAALNLWDRLEHPELLTELEISMRELALIERDL